MAAKNTLQFFLGPLLKKFFQDMGRDPNNLEMILLKQKAGQLLKDSNKVINFPQKRSFKEEIEAMKKSGDIVDADNIKISEKITDREMFKDANKRFKKKEEPIDPDFYDGPFDNEAEKIAEIKMSNEGFISDTIAKIKSMEPITAMKEANSVIGRKGKYKNLTPEQSKKILQDTEDHIFGRDIPEEDFASGGRAGLRFGGDTMGGRNDRSRSSPGPDRSRVSDRQQANHERAMNNRSNQGNRDYSPIKQIAKQTAINTAKTLARDKLMNTLGLAKFSNPIGIAMVLRNAYKQAKNPVLTEEDMTLGLMTDTQKDVIDKQVKMGKAIGSFDPDATFKAAKIFDDKGSGGVFGIGKREAEPMTREEYNEYISQKGFAYGGVAGLLGERPKYQTGGDVAFDASDASVYGSSAITVTPDAVMNQFGNQVQSQTGNNFNPGRPIVPEQGGITNAQDTTLPGLPALDLQTAPMSPGRQPGGGGSGITTLPDGTVYNPGRPMPPGGGLTLNPGATIDPNLINDKPRPGTAIGNFLNSGGVSNVDPNLINDRPSGPVPAVDLPGGQQPFPFMGKGGSKAFDNVPNNPFKIRSIEERKQMAEDMNNAPTGLMRADGTRANVTYENISDGRNTMPSMPATPVPFQEAQQLGGGMIQGFPGDPRLGAQQIEGNQLQMMMRGSGPPRRMPTAPAIIDIPEMQATQPPLIQLEAQPMPFASPSPSSSPIGQAAGMANGGRAGFMAGGMGRRGFLKMLAGLGAGIGAAKTGLLKFAGKEPAKQVAKEVVKKYKGFEMSEDVTTGDIVIKKRNEGVFYDQDGIISDEYIVYKPGQADEVTKMKTVDEYDEYTIRPDSDGKLTDAEDGLDSIDEILQEVGDQAAPIKNQTMNQTKSIKKASGGIARMLGE